MQLLPGPLARAPSEPFHHRILIKHIEDMGNLSGTLELMVVILQYPVYFPPLGIALLEDVISLFQCVYAAGTQGEQFESASSARHRFRAAKASQES